jgi:hypothetical protein
MDYSDNMHYYICAINNLRIIQEPRKQLNKYKKGRTCVREFQAFLGSGGGNMA